MDIEQDLKPMTATYVSVLAYKIPLDKTFASPFYYRCAYIMENFVIFQLNIVDLVTHVYIGVYKWEKVIKQKLFINIELHYKKEESFLDYATLHRKVIDLLGDKEYDLLEEVLEDLITFITSEYSVVKKCEVAACKPMAAFFRAARISASARWCANMEVATLDKL